MKVSLSWLQTHIDLGSYTTESLRDLLTFAGIEVEGIEQTGVASDKVVVAQIDSFVQHPNADKLSVCQVNDGSGTTKQIVCGAKNFKAGDKVPLALPGAVLPGGIEIKEGKLRDVVSQGMMCSGRELGIGEDHAGLLILDPATVIGTKFQDLVPSDTVFDLEITPNRSDLLSHRGLARELAALTKTSLNEIKGIKLPTTKQADKDQIELLATESGPFYSARRITGVKVTSSPEWLQKRLQSVGLRPINNVVDITNYVLLETGQPLHAFDAAKVNGAIQVRYAKAGETVKALDGNAYNLLETDLLIADSASPLAIAGVMGGEESGVTEATTDIILEAAYFTPGHVRRTARHLILSSDSSYRFERGVDPQNVLNASAFATQLILELAGGKAADEVLTAGEAPVLVQDVVFDEARARKLIGIPDLAAEEMHQILTSLGLKKVSTDSDVSTWNIPSYRLDLLRSVDLVEEIARVVGLDRVPSRTVGVFTAAQNTDKTYDFVMNVRQALINRGFHEAQTLRLISNAQLSDVLGAVKTPKTPSPNAVAVKNPLSEDHTVLRPSLIPGLLSVAELNIRQGLQNLRFFETGRVFILNPNGSSREEERLALLVSGPAHASTWNAKTAPVADIHTLRGVLDVLPGLAGQSFDLITKPLEGWLLSAEIKRGSKTLGWIAQVAPAKARQIDARHPIYVAEIAISALQQGVTGAVKFSELPKFPAIKRDVAFEVPADFPNAKVAAFFASQKEPLLVGYEIFDVFTDPTGTKLAADKKSVAWSLTYRSSERTLESKEVEEAHQRILKSLLGTLPASIR